MDTRKEFEELVESPFYKAMDANEKKLVRRAIKFGDVSSVTWHEKPVSVMVSCFDRQTYGHHKILVSANDYRAWFKEITGRECKW